MSNSIALTVYTCESCSKTVVYNEKNATWFNTTKLVEKTTGAWCHSSEHSEPYFCCDSCYSYVGKQLPLSMCKQHN